MNEIPAISIRQPWAELILRGEKTIEIRAWSTDYRGKLWLHVGKRSDPFNEEKFKIPDAYKGGFIGYVILEGIVPFDISRWQQWRPKHLDIGPFRQKTYAWLLGSPVRFKTPISAKGSLKLFYPTDDEFLLLEKAQAM